MAPGPGAHMPALCPISVQWLMLLKHEDKMNNLSCVNHLFSSESLFHYHGELSCFHIMSSF